MPGANSLLLHREANDALRFTADQHDPIEDALDRALSGALGIVAARLQGNPIGEFNSISQLFEGMRALKGAGTRAKDNLRPGLFQSASTARPSNDDAPAKAELLNAWLPSLCRAGSKPKGAARSFGCAPSSQKAMKSDNCDIIGRLLLRFTAEHAMAWLYAHHPLLGGKYSPSKCFRMESGPKSSMISK